MRVLHGGLSAATNPLSFSIVADYFPPEKRGTANAILSTGNFVGIALSSLSILGIKALGWRKSYQFMAVIGVMSGFFSLLMVREPPKKPSKKESKIKLQEVKFSEKDDSVSIKDKKGGFVKFLKQLGEIMKNLTCRYTITAGAFRSFSNMIVSCYLPVFF